MTGPKLADGLGSDRAVWEDGQFCSDGAILSMTTYHRGPTGETQDNTEFLREGPPVIHEMAGASC